MNLQLSDVLYPVVTLGGIYLLMRYFLPSYLTEKGKNLATKEDVTKITEK